METLPRFEREVPPEVGPGGERAARLRPGTVLAGAVAVVVLVGGGSVALLGGSAPLERATPATDTPPTPPAVSADTRPTSPAEVAVGSHQPLLSPPPVTWQLFSGVALPFSPTSGPLTVDGPVYAGYERSQTGALIAAAQLGTRHLLTPGEGWREVTGRQVLPGAGREVFLAARAEVDDLDVPPGTYGQFAGFRVVAFTPDVAVIAFVSRFALTGRLQTTTTTVKWASGDWRLELQPDGGTSPTAQAVPDLDGFVVWGGA
jgi:hypothetical protein